MIYLPSLTHSCLALSGFLSLSGGDLDSFSHGGESGVDFLLGARAKPTSLCAFRMSMSPPPKWAYKALQAEANQKYLPCHSAADWSTLYLKPFAEGAQQFVGPSPLLQWMDCGCCPSPFGTELYSYVSSPNTSVLMIANTTASRKQSGRTRGHGCWMWTSACW